VIRDSVNHDDRSAPDAERFLLDLFRQRFADADRPVIIAVGGPGGSGKSTLCRSLASRLGDCGVIALDDYRTPRAERAARCIFGPAPEANRFDLLTGHLRELRAGRPFDKPVYNMITGIADTTQRYAPCRFNLLDGETSTYPILQPQVDLAIFVDADLHTLWRTRLTRDITERGYTHRKAIDTFIHSNLREYARHVEPTRAATAVQLMRGADGRLTLKS